MQVRFEQTEYAVNETTSVEICILSFGESEKNVPFRISFESITAGGRLLINMHGFGNYPYILCSCTS